MLILSRKRTESIYINDSIIITVLQIRGNQVRIGIEAPIEVPVHRKELYERIEGQDLATEASAGNQGEHA